MDDQVRSVLARIFPDRRVERIGSTGPSWIEQNRTVRIEFADADPCYLKVALDGDGSRIRRETGLLEYVAANSEIPVPTVLASDHAGDPPFLVTAAVSGESLEAAWADGDVDARATLARELGAALAAVHEFRFETHGHVVGGNATTLELDEGPWTDVLQENIDQLRALSTSDRFDHHFDEVKAAVAANRDLLDDAPAALVHGDSWGPNCFLTESGMGFLDWELAHVGDPARELHRVREQQLGGIRDDPPEVLVSSLYGGYRDRAGSLPAGFEKRRHIYAAVRFLGYSGFFDEVVAYLGESPEEFARWMQAEKDRRLDAV